MKTLNIYRLLLMAFATIFITFSLPFAAMADAGAADAFVDENATGVGDCSSWADACTDLQSALEVASDLDGDGDVEIWIATGTYKPSVTYTVSGVLRGACGIDGSCFASDDVAMQTFNLTEVAGALDAPRKEVRLYGGFDGTERSLGEREVEDQPRFTLSDGSRFKDGGSHVFANETILSGDIGVIGDNADNVWHVITLSDDVALKGINVTLDGLTVQEGNANGPGDVFAGTLPYDHKSAGGIYSFLAAGATVHTGLTLSDITVRDNVGAERGGGLRYKDFFEESGSGGVIVLDSSFINNTVADKSSALRFHGADLSISNSVFKDNTSVLGSGALAPLLGGTGSIRDNLFVNNISGGLGGALASAALGGLGSDGELLVQNNTFDSNSASRGGGAILYVGTVPTGRTETVGNIFLNNSGGTLGGGAVIIIRSGIFTFTDNTFQDNSSLGAGGAIIARAAGPNGPPDEVIIIGDHFTDNIAGGNGGGLSFGDGVEAALCKVKAKGNEAGGSGGGLYAAGAGTIVNIAKSKFKKNEPDNIDDDDTATLTFFKKCEDLPS